MQRPSIIACAIAALAAPALGQVLAPTPYLQLGDSPFVGFAGFTADNLEDGTLDILGVTASAGATVIAPSSITDSVDADDGAIDGSGTAGRSLFAGGSVTIFFDAALIGVAPTQVGLVWTDGGGDITFSAFDTGGNLIGTVIGNHADGSITGETAEDRFYGVIHGAGIGSVTISNPAGIEVDHIQYALAPIPAPGAAGLLALAGGLAARRRRN